MTIVIEQRGDDGFTRLAYELPIRSEEEAEAVMELVAELLAALRGDPERSEAYQ